jgi:hypothetical protein
LALVVETGLIIVTAYVAYRWRFATSGPEASIFNDLIPYWGPFRYVDSLGSLREKLDRGIRSLDGGLGKELDIEDVIGRANAGPATI